MAEKSRGPTRTPKAAPQKPKRKRQVKPLPSSAARIPASVPGIPPELSLAISRQGTAHQRALRAAPSKRS